MVMHGDEIVGHDFGDAGEWRRDDAVAVQPDDFNVRGSGWLMFCSWLRG
jgi:hypothetical protein